MAESNHRVVYGLVSSISPISEFYGMRNASADTREDCDLCIVTLVCEENMQNAKALIYSYVTYE